MLSKRIFVVMFLLVFLLFVGCIPSAPPVEENQAPVIISVPITDAEVGVGYIYNVGATDPDEDSLIYSLIVKPNGMFINSITGLISWNPNSAQVGNNSVTVEVSDGELSDTQSFIIVVEEPCVPPCPPDPCDPPCPPTPQEVKLISIVVVPKTMTLFVGETEDIVSVTAHYSDGSTFVIDQQGDDYGNGSDDNSVATVSVIHVVTAVAKGTATITVMYEDKTDIIEVTVEAVKVIGIEASPDKMTLLTTQTQPLTVTAYYNNGFTADVTLDCIYVSSDPGEVDVTALGLVEAWHFGKFTITVTYIPNGEVFGDTVEVIVGPVHNITQDFYRNIIQVAIDDALTSAGDIIEVSAGTYNEDVTIGKVGITLQSGTKHEAIIEGTVTITANDVTVDGFSIKDFSQIPTTDWSGVYMPSGIGILVVNNLIDGIAIDPVANLTVGIHTLYGGTAEATLEGNIIRNVRLGIYSQGESLLINDNTIEDTAHCGIGVDTSKGTIIAGNNISNCGEYGIEVFGVDVIANFNNITGNTMFGVWSAGPQVGATNNWWGDASGPSGVGPGTGDAVNANVDYTPWSTTPH